MSKKKRRIFQETGFVLKSAVEKKNFLCERMFLEIGEKMCQLRILLKCFAFLSKNQLLGTTQFNDDVDIKSRHAAVNEL